MPFFLHRGSAPVHVSGFEGPEGETVSPNQVIEVDANPDPEVFTDVTPAKSDEQLATEASQVDGKQPEGADGDPTPTSPHDPAMVGVPLPASFPAAAAVAPTLP